MTAHPSPTINAAVAAFIEHCRSRGQAHSTIVSKQRSLDFLTRSAGGDRLVAGLTLQHFDQAIEGLKRGNDPEEARVRSSQGLPPRKARGFASIGIDKAALRQFAEYCRLERWVDPYFNPLVDIVASSKQRPDENGQVGVRAKRSVPESDWVRLLDAAEQHHARTRAIIAAGLYTGRRVSELVMSTWGQFDLSDGSYWYVSRKIGKRQEFALDETGLSEFRRWHDWMAENYGPVQPGWFVIPNKVHASRLDKWPSRDVRDRACGGESQIWPLLPDEPCCRNTALRDTKTALKMIGWEDLAGEGMHTLRRAHGRVVTRKKGIRVAQHSLGHAKASTTEGYLDTTEEREEAAKGFRGQQVFGPTTTPELPAQRQPQDDVKPLGNVVDLFSRRRVG